MERRPSVVIGEVLDALGPESLQSTATVGYRGDLSDELLALYGDDEGAARRAVQRLAYDRIERAR